jgi:8-oxo-dGTP pyrophosphatase MutT (NUDIX family)
MTIIRHAVRAILVDPASHRLLLMRARAPDDRRDLWLTPGGGIEPGESERAALRREVWEETGLRLDAEAPPVWTRRHRYRFGGQDIDQHERFFFAPTTEFEPTSRHNPADAEMMVFREFRWWDLNAIEATTEVGAPLGAIFVPSQLAPALRALLNAGPPSAPFDIGE